MEGCGVLTLVVLKFEDGLGKFLYVFRNAASYPKIFLDCSFLQYLNSFLALLVSKIFAARVVIST